MACSVSTQTLTPTAAIKSLANAFGFRWFALAISPDTPLPIRAGYLACIEQSLHRCLTRTQSRQRDAGSNRHNKLTSGTNTDFLTQLSQNLGFDRQHNNVCGIHQFLIGSDPDAVFFFKCSVFELSMSEAGLSPAPIPERASR